MKKYLGLILTILGNLGLGAAFVFTFIGYGGVFSGELNKSRVIALILALAAASVVIILIGNRLQGGRFLPTSKLTRYQQVVRGFVELVRAASALLFIISILALRNSEIMGTALFMLIFSGVLLVLSWRKIRQLKLK